MDYYTEMKSIDAREVLTALIRAAGVGRTARQARIATASLSQWLAGDNSIGPAKLDEIFRS